MDVFKETGLTKRHCGEDDDCTDTSDTEAIIGSTCGGSSSDDTEWVDDEFGNHQEQLATIIQHVGSTGISVDEVQKQWWGEAEYTGPTVCRAAVSGVFNPCKKTKHTAPEAEKALGKLLPSLQSISAMLLMTVLYAARVARYDLFKPIN